VTYGAAAGSAGISSQSITVSQTPDFPVTCNTVLALGSLSASAVPGNGTITVNWQVTNENDMQGYSVERSFNGVLFSAIASVTPQLSGSNTNYSYTDAPAGDQSGVVYYRIKATDLNGRNFFSKIIPVYQSAQTVKLTVTPNPVEGDATLSFMSDHNASVSISLIDISGKTLWKKQYQARTGMNFLPLDHLQELPTGLYFLQYYNGEDHDKVKVVIRH
jgi:hypothetical protein